MMRCEEVIELLEAYVEGELDESEQEIVETHISGCELCKQELALTQSIPSLVGSLQTPSVPEDIVPNTLERLQKTPTARRWWLRSWGAFLSRKWQLTGVVCALLIISLLSIGYHRMNREPKITDAEVAAAAADLKLALGIVGTATQDVEYTALTAGAKALSATRSKSKDTMQTLSRTQSEVSEKLRLAVLGH